MGIRHFILAIMAVVSQLATAAWAQSEFVERAEVHTREGLQVLLTYPENGVHKVSQFKVSPEGFQELILQEAFSTAEKARARNRALLEQLKKREVLPRNAYLFNQSVNVGGSRRGGEIYETKNEWDDSWEQKFADWIRHEITTDFFVKYKIATDCADAAYALRWIFARIHGLRMGVTLSASRKILTNETNYEKWEHLPTANEWHEDKRFRAALQYILLNTYTHSLYDDTYPVALSRPYFREGVIQLSINKNSGHTMILNFVGRPGENYRLPVTKFWSTVPQAIRTLEVGLVYESQPTKDNSFRAFRWPRLVNGQVVLTRSEAMPGYSLEQFDPAYSDGYSGGFGAAMLAKLWPDFKPIHVLEGSFQEVIDMFKARAQVVREGYAHCQKNDCREGTQAYEDWSTPSRDRRLGQAIERTRDLVAKLKDIDPQVTKRFYEGRLELVEIDGQKIPYQALEFIWDARLYSSDPNVAPERRWNAHWTHVAQYLNEKVEQLLRAREKKVLAKQPSGEEDSELLWLMIVAEEYAERLSDKEKFKALIQSLKITANGTAKSVREWLHASQAFSANPRSSARWGENVPTYRLIADERLAAGVDANGWVFTKNAPISVTNVLTGEAKQVTSLFVPMGHVPQREALIGLLGSQFAMYDIKRNTAEPLAQSTALYQRHTWIGERYLFLELADRILLYDFSSTSPRVILQVPKPSRDGLSYNGRLSDVGGLYYGGVLYHYDLSGAQPVITRQAVSLNGDAKFSSKVLLLNRLARLNNSQELYGHDGSLFVFDITNKVLTQRKDLAGIIVVQFPVVIKVVNNELYAAMMGLDLSVQVTNKFPPCGFWPAESDAGYLPFYCGQEMFVYEFTQNGLVPFTLPAGHKIVGVTYLNRRYLISRKGDREYVWDVHTKSQLLEASRFILSEVEGNTFVVAIENTFKMAPELYELKETGPVFRGQGAFALYAGHIDGGPMTILPPTLDDIYERESFSQMYNVWPGATFYAKDSLVYSVKSLRLWLPVQD